MSAIFTIITFYALRSLATSDETLAMRGGTTIQITLKLGCGVVGFFSVIFLYYTNNFLMKQRKKELALYCILGLEKKHMARVLFYETLLTMGITLTSGLIIGAVLCKLLFLILANMVQFTTNLSFDISIKAMGETAILYSIIFVTIFIKNFIQVKLTNPIQLLKGGQVGEKEPKASWLVALLGAISLGAGYYMALTIKSPIAAIGFFFVAVILVIIGTNLLFIAGSLVVLKSLKKNKKFYYKAKNFVSVSGMIYRMKQNAVGLSNICILSTMVLVVLSSTISMYIGQKDAIEQLFPYDFMVRADLTSTDYDVLTKVVDNTVQETDAEVSKSSVYRYFELYTEFTGSGVLLGEDWTGQYSSSKENILVEFIPLADYNQSQNQSETLQENEVLLYMTQGDYNQETFQVNDVSLKVKKELASFDHRMKVETSISPTIYVIVRDYEYAYELCQQVLGDRFEEVLHSTCNYRVQMNVENSKEEVLQIAKKLKDNLDQANIKYRFDCKQENEDELYAVNGGLLFIGIFLGVLFMMAAVLIIYYKQISEGYDDHDRFLIMQKVGLSNKEVKATIQKQVWMVFFLPLAVAICHICFALPMIKRILAIFSLYNTLLINLCTIATIGVFAIAYVVVYMLTAREYYKIVRA